MNEKSVDHHPLIYFHFPITKLLRVVSFGFIFILDFLVLPQSLKRVLVSCFGQSIIKNKKK